MRSSEPKISIFNTLTFRNLNCVKFEVVIKTQKKLKESNFATKFRSPYRKYIKIFLYKKFSSSFSLNQKVHFWQLKVVKGLEEEKKKRKQKIKISTFFDRKAAPNLSSNGILKWKKGHKKAVSKAKSVSLLHIRKF